MVPEQSERSFGRVRMADGWPLRLGGPGSTAAIDGNHLDPHHQVWLDVAGSDHRGIG
jgi:hypothetical protein